LFSNLLQPKPTDKARLGFEKPSFSNPIMDEQAILSRVEQALDTVRPYLIADGGNVNVLQLTDEGVLQIQMVGNCGTCPISHMTLKTGIEQAIFTAVPEITKIEAVNLSQTESN
jgi:Fe-S cluster biogenesis protein NfuA